MSSMEEIAKQVRALPPDELARFREWFYQFAADDWDRQIAADLEAGRLDGLLEEAQNDLEAGRFGELRGMVEGGPRYFDVVIIARSPTTDIWLAHEGHLVQKSDGTLETSILPGHYTVEFGLGSPTYLLNVTSDVRWTEEGITAGDPCPRPIPSFPPLDSDS